MGADRTFARRAAVVAIFEPAARSLIARVVDEAVGAASLFGLTQERGDRYAEGIRSTLPVALETMALPDGPERSAGLDRLAAATRAVSETHHIPHIVERGLTAIAVRVAREVVRRGAAERGFTPDELEAEVVAFADQLQARLFA